MSDWYIYNKKENYEKLSHFNQLTSIQKLILANRDVVEENKVNSVVNSSLDRMYSPFLLKDMDQAVEILFNAMMQEFSIRIVGDYDADGVTSTTILMKGLAYFYDDLSYVIPDRIEDGYGINKNIVDQAYKDNVSLIITCDNGIAAFEAIEYARNKGIDVIITDHHQTIKEDGRDLIPKANAVVNPSQMECRYPYKNICGAVVSYKLLDAFHERYGQEFGISKEYIHDLLQFAAIGTITDVMDLVDENRIIVIEGLKRVNKTNNLGLMELISQLDWNKEITVYTIGFIIGPVINATGRLFTAKLAVELFLEDDPSVLVEYARELIALNNDRKNITKTALEDALLLVEKDKLYKDDIIFLYMKDIHESICGLVAGRIKEIYNKPILVFTDANSDTDKLLKGSGRSIEAYNMHEQLGKYKDYYLAFGGHKMACGLTLTEENFQEVKTLANRDSTLSQKDFNKTINIDAALDFRVINFDLVRQIQDLEPFGKAFEKPKFASKSVIINNIALLGKDKNLLKMTLTQNNKNIDSISFNVLNDLQYLQSKFNINNIERNFDQLLGKNIDIVYSIQINKFRDKENIQLILEEMR
ncbi:MAG: single-stranded-DNA-specific exonuclease RecJ [Tissierellia bacterium]|nr:single-stranded-DNA-specific exonuclease RecJ [Tissierellia bacterium]